MERGEEVIDTSTTTVHSLGGKTEGRRLRFMQKDGRFPVVLHKAPGDWSPYFTDIFTTLVEIRWRVMLLVFCLSYVLSWLFFGLCYFLIAYVNGDIDDYESNACIANLHTFTAAFLYSMETQATIGYGFRVMTENCIVAITMLTVQDVCSRLLNTIIIGIVAAKMASARKRAHTVGFSRRAVVNLRDGALCLSWRIGDFRGNHILEGVVKAQLVHYVKKPLGFVVISYDNLEIQDRDIVLATPAVVIHKLEPGSPLYGLTPDDLLDNYFELVVSFTYTGDSTGILHQTRTSYTPADIHWGQQFRDMLRQGKKHYKVDYALFNETTWVSVPHISAEEYDRRGRPKEDDNALPITVNTNRHTNFDVTSEVMHQTFL